VQAPPAPSALRWRRASCGRTAQGLRHLRSGLRRRWRFLALTSLLPGRPNGPSSSPRELAMTIQQDVHDLKARLAALEHRLTGDRIHLRAGGTSLLPCSKIIAAMR